MEAFHAGLQGADRIDFGDEDGGTLAAEGLGTALANVAITADNSFLTRNHDVGGALDAVDQRFAAAIEVVELRLGNAVVDVDGWPQQGAISLARSAAGGAHRWWFLQRHP